VARVPGAAAGDRAALEDSLREIVRRKLPEYMVPVAIVTIPELPLTANGKVDRNRLPDPEAFYEPAAFTGPRNPIEQQLAAIWCETLSIEQIGVFDNVFDRGADSMTAIHAHRRIRQELAADIPVVELYNRPTVAALAGYLEPFRERAAGNDPVLISVQPHGARRPLFFVPGVLGSPFYLSNLARSLGDRPFYGFESPGLDGRAEAVTSIEELAARYVAAMRACQPEGPYLLAAQSWGGYVVHEMTRQLAAAGQRVAFAGFLDSVVVRSSFEALQGDSLAMKAVVRALYSVVGEHLPISYEELSAIAPSEQLARVLDSLRERSVISPMVHITGIVNVFKTNMKAMTDYVLHADGPPITLFRTTEGLPEEFSEYEDDENLTDPTLGWRKYASEVEVVTVPGSHLTLLSEPHLSVLASALRERLDRAEGMA